MTMKRKVAAGAAAVLVAMAGALWWLSPLKSTHVIVIPPVQGVGR